MARNKRAGNSPSFQHASSFARLAGQGTKVSTARFSQLKMVLDFETDIANIKSEWIVPALLNMINDKVIYKWNATQIDNYADLVCYGAQLLAELKAQLTQIEYVPGLTRDDAAAGSTFSRPTLEGLLASLGEVRIPPMSYAFVNLFNKVIQIGSSQVDEGTLATYLAVHCPSKTLAQIETLLGTITGLYDAAVYASQSGQMLIPIDMNWLLKINEVSMGSQFAMCVARFFPINYDNGGVETETEETFSTDTLFWSSVLGIPEYYDALAAYRGSSGAPHICVVQSIANDKISINKAAAPGTTVYTEVDKTSTDYDWMSNVSAARSVSHTGMYANLQGSLDITYKATVLASAAAWDRRITNWLSDHSRDPSITEYSMPVGIDIIGTSNRGNVSVSAVARESGDTRQTKGKRKAKVQDVRGQTGYKYGTNNTLDPAALLAKSKKLYNQ